MQPVLEFLHGRFSGPEEVTGTLVPDTVIPSGRGFILAGDFVTDGCSCALAGDGLFPRTALPHVIDAVKFPDGTILRGHYRPDSVTHNGGGVFTLNGTFFPADQLNGFRLKMSALKLPKLKLPKRNLSPGKALGKIGKGITRGAQQFSTGVGDFGSGIGAAAGAVYAAPANFAIGAASGVVPQLMQPLQNITGVLGFGQQQSAAGQGQQTETQQSEQQYYDQSQQQQSAADPSQWVQDTETGMYYNGYGEWYDPASGQKYDPSSQQWYYPQGAAA